MGCSSAVASISTSSLLTWQLPPSRRLVARACLRRPPPPPCGANLLLGSSARTGAVSASSTASLSGRIGLSASSRPCSARMAGEAGHAAATEPIRSSGGKAELLVFQIEEELASSLAKYTAELSDKCVRERGAFSVVLSGGSLIKSLRKLIEPQYAELVDWARWHVFWVDERVVPKDHVDSNYKLAYDGFLSKVPIPPGQVYAINDSLPAEGAADDYEAVLKQLVTGRILRISEATGCPVFDLMLLGMGPDGHVASLFPNHPLLNESTRWVTFIKDSPKPPPERITFTFPVINSSANIVLVVAGAGKADAVQRALGAACSSSGLLPVQMVSPGSGKLTWFTDRDAVSKLQNK